MKKENKLRKVGRMKKLILILLLIFSLSYVTADKIATGTITFQILEYYEGQPYNSTTGEIINYTTQQHINTEDSITESFNLELINIIKELKGKIYKTE